GGRGGAPGTHTRRSPLHVAGWVVRIGGLGPAVSGCAALSAGTRCALGLPFFFGGVLLLSAGVGHTPEVPRVQGLLPDRRGPAPVHPDVARRSRTVRGPNWRRLGHPHA